MSQKLGGLQSQASPTAMSRVNRGSGHGTAASSEEEHFGFEPGTPPSKTRNTLGNTAAVPTGMKVTKQATSLAGDPASDGVAGKLFKIFDKDGVSPLARSFLYLWRQEHPRDVLPNAHWNPPPSS